MTPMLLWLLMRNVAMLFCGQVWVNLWYVQSLWVILE
jgi:hypothetical protein